MNRVLIVEDLCPTRAWLCELVRAAIKPTHLAEADTLAEAQSLIDAQQFDLALIDLGLPDGNGVELIRRLSSDQSGCISIVATLFDDDRHLFPALRAGAKGYLLKDEPHESLSQKLQQILRGGTALSDAAAHRMIAFFHESAQDQMPLTVREQEVLRLIALGQTVARCAQTLRISPHTAAGYVKEVYRKLGISSRSEATLEAIKMGLIEAD